MNDVVIEITPGGLGRKSPSEDNNSGLIMNGIAVTSGVQLDTVYELKSIDDAAGLLIDAAYDSTNSVLVFYHISEFFRMNPNGKLYLILAAQSNSLADMLDLSNVWSQLIIRYANGKIRQLGVALNPATSYVPTLAGGLDQDSLDAIAAGQLLADFAASIHMPLVVVVEGRSLNGAVSSTTDLRTLQAKDVCCVIAQDADVAAGHAIYAKHAAVGTILGTISLAKVNEDIGWPEKFRLDYIPSGTFINANFSSNASINTYTHSNYDSLNDKGYIFPRTFVGMPGVYFNDSHTCDVITSDFAYIENDRTLGKVIRISRAALLPKVNSPITVDAVTGQIDAAIAKGFEMLVKSALTQMERDSEVSGIEVFVDPDQNILASSELEVSVSVIPTGTARMIKIKIGFQNPFNS